jgi:outer membrane protein OmpA-like peptidoglycan-associated protein
VFLPCPTLAFSSPANGDRMVVVPATDGLALCRTGEYEEIPRWHAGLWLELLNPRDTFSLRRFILQCRLPVGHIDRIRDREFLPLVRGAVARGELLLLRESAEGGGGPSRLQQERRLVRKIEACVHGLLNHKARSYRLVVGQDMGRLRDLDNYEVVGRAETLTILSDLSSSGTVTSELARLLAEIRPLLAADWRQPARPDGIAMLRRARQIAAPAPASEAPLTPSQFKTLIKPSDWIEIEVVDQDDIRYTGGYSLALPDGTSQGGQLQNGYWEDHDIETGTCTLKLLRALRAAGNDPATSQQTQSPPGLAAPSQNDEPSEEPAAEEVEFSAEVVDELGKAVPDAALIFGNGSGAQVVPTDGNGIAKWKTSGATSVQVGFVAASTLAKTMKPRWSTCRGVDRSKWIQPDATTTIVTLTNDTIYKATPDPTSRTQTLQPFTFAPSTASQPARISVQPLVTVARLLAKHFDLNKCFLLPTALGSPAEVVRLRHEYADADVLIVGHTDTSADPDYNLDLSVERAKAMRDYLINNVDGWLAWYGSDKSDKKRWGTTEDTYMIGALVEGSSCPATIVGYQQWHNSLAPSVAGSEPLKADGIMGPATRKQLVLDYMNREGTTLPAGTPVEIHGCGEYFPLDASGLALDTNALDGQHEPIDRRVEVYFFPKELGVLPPVPAVKARKTEGEYPEWRYRSTEVEFVAGPAPEWVEVRLVDELDTPLAGIPLQFSASTGATSLDTDGDGRAIWPSAGSGTVVRVADEPAVAEMLATLDPTARRTTAFPTVSPTHQIVGLAELRTGVAVPTRVPVTVMVVLRSRLVHTVPSTRWSGLSLDQDGPWRLEQDQITTLSMLHTGPQSDILVQKTSDGDLPLDREAIDWLSTSVEALHGALVRGDFGPVWDVLRAIPLSVVPPDPTSDWPNEDPATEPPVTIIPMPNPGGGGST